MDTFLDEIKAELRITHSNLDDLLSAQADEACFELLRLGIPFELISLEHPLIKRAVKDFVLSQNTEGDKSDKYMGAFKYEADCLRKSTFPEVGDGE